ncbi:MAG TPA: response regulator [Dyadobacter sp.]|jgi:CheY-like chemotaxis protein|nr:response regulator [Dyadobacter sp.]
MTKKEIFLVEDSSDFRQLVRTIFSKFLPEYSVRSFQGGSELYQYMVMQSSEGYTGRRPSLIIMDLHLPTLDGYEILKLIRQTPPNTVTDWKTLPVVMLSASSKQSDVNRCYQAGANSFFIKPVDFEELKKLLETICHYWVDYNILVHVEQDLSQFQS